MRSTIAIFLAVFVLSQKISAQPTDNQDTLLSRICSNYKEYFMRAFPESATYNGDHRYDGMLADISDRAEHNRIDSLRSFLKDLKFLRSNELSAENKVTCDLFSQNLEQELAGEKFHFHYIPLDQQSGIHINFPQLVEVQPLQTFGDYFRYFSRLRLFKQQVMEAMNNMTLGIKAGILPPKFVVEQVLTQIEAIKNKPTDSCVFFLPFNNQNKLTDEEKPKVKKQLQRMIDMMVKPAYQQLYDFVKNEYLPKCKDEAGLWNFPDGKARYEYLIQSHTTTQKSADEIFDLGMSEVKRIWKEMEKVKSEFGFKGLVSEFNNSLRNDSKNFYTKKEDLMKGFAEMLKKVDKKLPEYFGYLPKAKYDLKEIEEYRAASAPQAYYYKAPEDRSRPGYFYVNTTNLPARPKYTMTSLAMHEAVPGHHLQIAIAQELQNLPWVRRQMGYTAFVEGWGLYSESLGYEMGMYNDKYQHYGALSFEMWRACRLVVDAGIHSKKWTRQQAVDFMKKHIANSEADIVSEVDRYISMPAQALAYKIGELKIKELRKKAETELGDKFLVKEFHDKVLENGAIPLSLLEVKVNQWIVSKK